MYNYICTPFPQALQFDTLRCHALYKTSFLSVLHHKICILFTYIGPPQFRSRASNATVFSQQSPVTFTFDACAGTTPTISWSRVTINGEESIPGFYNHIHATGSTLTLDHASIIRDVGEYTYRVSNSYGTIQDTVYLIVFGKYVSKYVRTYVFCIKMLTFVFH